MNKYRYLNFILIFVIVILGGVLWSQKNLFNRAGKVQLDTDYNPSISPSNFVSSVSNPFFTLTPGKKFVYESVNIGEKERIEVEVTSDTKVVMDIKTTVVRDRMYVDNELFEDTFDYYAQDLEGNVWYFGEETKEYEDGTVSTKGSWEAGIKGAKPGIIMKAKPKIGDSYRQEYFVGEAEDMGDVVGVGESVSISFCSFSWCLKTGEWSVIEKSANEYKYYCPQVGFLVLEETVNGTSKVELVSVE